QAVRRVLQPLLASRELVERRLRALEVLHGVEWRAQEQLAEPLIARELLIEGHRGGDERRCVGLAHYSFAPSKCLTSSASTSMPSTQRTLIAVIDVPSGRLPLANDLMPQCLQKL